VTSGLWPDIRATINGDFWVPAGTIITGNGTMIPNGDGPGFSADLARALMEIADGMWIWKWVNYPAATFPMRNSINVGKTVLKAIIRATPGKIVLSGYSQFAIVTGEVWRDDIRNPDGELHDRLDDIEAVIQYGDPLRTPGIAYGNELAGIPAPGKLDGVVTGGIAGPNCLRPEECLHPVTGRKIVLSVANPGDLYASAPVGETPWISETEVGHLETLIFEAVMEFDGHDIVALAKVVVKVVTQPLSIVLPLVQAIWNGLKFVGQGMNAPHWTYKIDGAVRFMVGLGAKLRAGRSDQD
jgi:hypothetical protein